MHWELTSVFLSCHYRQHHKGQRVRGDDADWLWSNRHQDPPHQVLHHPTFAQGQPHRHVLPALSDWEPGCTSCRCAHGVCLRSPAAPELLLHKTQTEHKTSVNTSVCKAYLKSGVLLLTLWLWFRAIQSSQYKESSNCHHQSATFFIRADIWRSVAPCVGNIDSL